ncbi:hypothetical protein OE88DRAFT_1804088 [Heliocybe sulcata]|uniref:Uncharacterized protein n=1 Tax=Heliocybe sulcata TaxID=5364 RepID=A0A5C3NK16_9AGAM|nr:hypothetical protein OE88DRAFT_1804088 [Heliocybe sulcata]
MPPAISFAHMWLSSRQCSRLPMNGRLCQRAFQKEKKPAKRLDTSHGRHMTCDEALDYLAKAQWEATMKDLHKEAGPVFKQWRNKIMEFERDEKKKKDDAEKNRRKEEKAQDHEKKEEEKRLEKAKAKTAKQEERKSVKALREAEEAARKAARLAARRKGKGRKARTIVEAAADRDELDSAKLPRPKLRPRYQGAHSGTRSATAEHDVPSISPSQPTSNFTPELQNFAQTRKVDSSCQPINHNDSSGSKVAPLRRSTRLRES